MELLLTTSKVFCLSIRPCRNMSPVHTGRAEVQDEQKDFLFPVLGNTGVCKHWSSLTEGIRKQHLLISFRRFFKADTWQRGMSSALRCVWYLLNARLRNNPPALPGSHEQRICSPSDRLGTLCETVQGTRDRCHSLHVAQSCSPGAASAALLRLMRGG